MPGSRVFVAAALLLPMFGQAQSAPPRTPRRGVVMVTVVDTGANPPTKPFFVQGLARGIAPDRRPLYLVNGRPTVPGRFRLDSMPADTVLVGVACPTIRGLGLTKGNVAVAVRADTAVDLTITVDHVGCDPRAVRTETGMFSGYYTPGFESSEFVPCPNDTWVIPSDRVAERLWEPRAWVEGFTEWDRITTLDRFSGRRASRRDQTYYVRWWGTMTGPGQYGHMGVSDFELRVDSVTTLELPSATSCPWTWPPPKRHVEP